MINGHRITKKWMAVNVLLATNAAKNPANQWISNPAGDLLKNTKVSFCFIMYDFKTGDQKVSDL